MQIQSVKSSAFSFQGQFIKECIEGSAISPALVEANIEFIEDTGRWETYQLLGWDIRTQWQTCKPWDTGIAAVFLHENKEPWQIKLQNPPIGQNGKIQKYNTPKGTKANFYKPAVPVEIRRKIGQRYNIQVPEFGSFWDWVLTTPGLTFVHTEGGKKAKSLFTQGFIAIGHFGVNSGYRVKDDEGNPISARLIDDVAAFCRPGCTNLIAFDQDEKRSVRRRVDVAISRYGRLLEATGGIVKVVEWDGKRGKGIDDFIAKNGPEALETVIANAVSLKQVELRRKLQQKLTITPNLVLDTADISAVSGIEVPDTGIIAIASPKGTGKTKFIANLVKDSDKALALGHRVVLMRNVCERIGFDYRGDLDKAQGNFISETGFTEKIGTCVDSLLACDPEKFRGCVLIIDEFCQVIRHLLTSSTCNKDGKRPALLKRFEDIIKVADLVVATDADADDINIHYLETLRGEKAFLVRNDFKAKGPKTYCYNAPDSSVLMKELFKDVEDGLNVFVVTDSLGGSKAIAASLQKIGINPLLINSETSGGEIERAFITNPNETLEGIQVVIASPSLGTGLSIEVPHFDKVYGFFYGTSINDADMGQSLARVRAEVPRMIWCAQYGRNFCSIGRSVAPFRLKALLKVKLDTTTSLLRSSLRADTLTFDFENDPHIQLWSQLEAQKNAAMLNLRESLIARLKHEGNEVIIIDCGSDKAMKVLLRQTRQEIKDRQNIALLNARILTLDEAKRLEDKENVSPEDRLALQRHHLCEFYAISPDNLTLELIELDNDGRFRGQFLNYENQVEPGLALFADMRSIERQEKWKVGVTPWDVTHSEVNRKMRSALDIEKFMDPDFVWTKYSKELEEFAETAWKHRDVIKATLNYTVKKDQPPAQLLGELLRQLGLKTTFQWSRRIEGHEGEKLRVYSIDPVRYQQCQDILSRRKARREALGSDAPYIDQNVSLIRTENMQNPFEMVVGGTAIYAPDGSVVRITRLHEGIFWARRETDPILRVAFPVSLSELRAIA